MLVEGQEHKSIEQAKSKLAEILKCLRNGGYAMKQLVGLLYGNKELSFNEVLKKIEGSV